MGNEITDMVTPNKPNQRQIYPVYILKVLQTYVYFLSFACKQFLLRFCFQIFHTVGFADFSVSQRNKSI